MTSDAIPAISLSIAEFTSRFSYDDLPQRLREFARYHALDTVGTSLAATKTDFARSAYEGLAPLAEGGACSVIGMSAKLGLRDAVLLNGILAHGLDYDDTHTPSQMHPSASAFPCALGLAEFQNKSGCELLMAYVLGAEISIRTAIASANTMQSTGFHSTGVIGHFGCAIAASKLYELNAAQTCMAQGLAGSTASALGEYRSDGSWNKRMHPGWAAVGGITAASLARGGYVGSKKIYEGRDGVFRTHAGPNFEAVKLDAMLDGLGSEWRFEGAAIKPLPVCHFLHACADSVLALRREHNLDPDDILEAQALLPKDAFRVVCEPVDMRRRPASENVAQFSAQFVVAACLVRGKLTFAELSPESLADERILAIAQRVTYDECPGSLYPRYHSGGATLKTKDGRTLTHVEPINRGNGERALSNDEIVAKFMENAQLAVSHDVAERMRDRVLDIERISAREFARAVSMR